MVTLPVILFPTIDPVIYQIGPFALRWYAISYIVGLLLGWRYMMRLTHRPEARVDTRHADDFLLWATLGVVLGGRLGYVLFYKPGLYLSNPLEIVKVWEGGMSFHGGMLGVVLALLLFARRRHIPVLALSDLVAAAVPIGLFFGRIANFINAELWGRVTDVPWGVDFSAADERAGDLPRHPSQLYEAALEGVALFVLLLVLTYRFRALRQPGLMTGAFLAGYGVFRIIGEDFRQPDEGIGFLFGDFLTMGHLLSLPMVVVGLGLIIFARRRRL